jgi:hypothetical protein
VDGEQVLSIPTLSFVPMKSETGFIGLPVTALNHYIIYNNAYFLHAAYRQQAPLDRGLLPQRVGGAPFNHTELNYQTSVEVPTGKYLRCANTISRGFYYQSLVTSDNVAVNVPMLKPYFTYGELVSHNYKTCYSVEFYASVYHPRIVWDIYAQVNTPDSTAQIAVFDNMDFVTPVYQGAWYPLPDPDGVTRLWLDMDSTREDRLLREEYANSGVLLHAVLRVRGGETIQVDDNISAGTPTWPGFALTTLEEP